MWVLGFSTLGQKIVSLACLSIALAVLSFGTSFLANPAEATRQNIELVVACLSSVVPATAIIGAWFQWRCILRCVRFALQFAIGIMIAMGIFVWFLILRVFSSVTDGERKKLVIVGCVFTGQLLLDVWINFSMAQLCGYSRSAIARGEDIWQLSNPTPVLNPTPVSPEAMAL